VDGYYELGEVCLTCSQLYYERVINGKEAQVKTLVITAFMDPGIVCRKTPLSH
jgi:hypothetical protein